VILDLDHINIATDRLAETRAFYIEVLGMTERWRPDFPFDGHWLYIGDRPLVHLVGSARAGVGCDQAALSHIAFAIDDIDGFAARLTEKGVAFREIGAPGTPIRQLFFDDPNGVTIELNYLGARTAAERSAALIA
jgi:catechol 2,3-dioxygenase-like lactoylglutathione lyase family enzyme